MIFARGLSLCSLLFLAAVFLWMVKLGTDAVHFWILYILFLVNIVQINIGSVVRAQCTPLVLDGSLAPDDCSSDLLYASKDIRCGYMQFA